MYQNYNPYYGAQQSNGIIWVQGIEGAKAYQMMPNTNVILLDSENDGVFYIKICDSVGMCTLRIFNYHEVEEQKKTEGVVPDLTQYVTKSELKEALDELKEAIYGKQALQSA